ncbi:MAG: spermidine/putrescine ABC transporter substrate-binding protein, partial [Actinomycetota bacterium]
MTKMQRTLAAAFGLAMVAAACGEDDGAAGDGTTEAPVVYDEIGELEGQLELIAWHGYTEDGTTEGYEGTDWVTPFEDATGC